ncbi:uncharacterized protein [Branchiostoma lanceolatum]|uniref:uncharacterized protein n=1 Tax=Branchiostoma lanceolatum TaxID=7740 RepID=UPI0034531E0C
MTGYPVELVTTGNGTIQNKGRGRSLSMSAIQSKTFDENDNVAPYPAKLKLRRSQSLKVLDANSWQNRIARTRSEDNIHRKSPEGVFEESHDNTENIDAKQSTVTNAHAAKSNSQARKSSEDVCKKNVVPIAKIDGNQQNNQKQFRRHIQEDKSRCEGIEEEANEFVETARTMEDAQCVPPSPDEVGTASGNERVISTATCNLRDGADSYKIGAEGSACTVAQESKTPKPDVRQHTPPSSASASGSQVPPYAAAFAQFMNALGSAAGSPPQGGSPSPPAGCVFNITMNNCNNVQFGNQNIINSTQHHEQQFGGKFDGLNQGIMRLLMNLEDPQKEQEMVSDLQDEDKCKDLVSGLKEFGTQLKTAKEGCVLLDFELSKDPEERLRFLRSCQSGEFQRFIQENLLSRYVQDPTKVSMVLCFSIASITDTGCGEMSFNFNLLQGGPDVTTSGGLEGLRQYTTLSGLKFVESCVPHQSDVQSCLGDVLDPGQRSAFQLHLSNAQRPAETGRG